MHSASLTQLHTYGRCWVPDPWCVGLHGLRLRCRNPFHGLACWLHGLFQKRLLNSTLDVSYQVLCLCCTANQDTKTAAGQLMVPRRPFVYSCGIDLIMHVHTYFDGDHSQFKVWSHTLHATAHCCFAVRLARESQKACVRIQFSKGPQMPDLAELTEKASMSIGLSDTVPTPE